MKKLLMKKILIFFIITGFLFVQCPFSFAKDELQDLPALPDFDSVMPPDGIDAFAPSSTPAQVAPKETVSTTTPAPSTVQKNNVSQTTKPVSKQPSTPPSTVVTQPAVIPQKPVNTANNSYYKNNLKNSYVVPKGKKFKVRLQQTISDKTPEGTRISFVSVYPETSTYITIPSGTIFKGKISDSHPPYITGNGGLIVINVDQMIYKGKAYEIDAKVSVANGKRIFLNNIKGKRQYFQSIPKAMKPGNRYFKKMWRVTCNLAKNDSGVEIILTPFSLLTGTVVWAVNFVTSPVLAIFYKGKSITIPKDSPFTIQLREDAILLK